MQPEKTPPVFSYEDARQAALATLFVAAVGLGFWLVFRYRMVILILFAAVILGTALQPLVDRLSRTRLPRPAALALVYLMLLLAGGALLLAAAPLFTAQLVELAGSLPGVYRDVRISLLDSSSRMVQNIGLFLAPDLELALRGANPNTAPLDAVAQFMQWSSLLLRGVLGAAAVFLVTSFWILESERSVRGLLMYFPPRIRRPAQELFEAIEGRVGDFVRGQLILCLSIAILALIAYLIIGLPNALALAVIAGVFEAVPYVGPVLGAIPALLTAFSLDPAKLIWVLGATVLMQVLENNLLVPRIMGASVGVNPILTLLVLATFGSLLGLPGALLAIPLAAVVQLLLDRYVLSREAVASLAAPDGRGVASALRYEVQDLIGDVRKRVREREAPPDETSDQVEEAIESLARELDIYLSRAAGESTE